MSAPANRARVETTKGSAGNTAHPIAKRKVAVTAAVLAIATIAATIARKRTVR